MKSKLSKQELRTTHYMKLFVGDILHLLSQHFGGDTTLNHLEIGTYIGLMSQYEDQPTSNKDISKALGIPRSTVSRIVADLIAKKWVVQVPHPEDGRRKLFLIPHDHPLADHFEKKFRTLTNKLFQHYESRKLVMVDPKKKSF
jgi:DNA-binding MarR family transcriptional regulator